MPGFQFNILLEFYLTIANSSLKKISLKDVICHLTIRASAPSLFVNVQSGLEALNQISYKHRPGQHTAHLDNLFILKSMPTVAT